jgi:putative DNA primase/helicase
MSTATANGHVTTPTLLSLLEPHLARDLNRWPDVHGEFHADCPYCHKPAKAGQTHFAIAASGKCYCQVCQQGTGLRALATHLGVQLGTSASSSSSQITYDYHDAAGQLVYQVVRYYRGGQKLFYQRRPDGKGGWIKSLKGVHRLLYRLPEVLQAIAAGERIYIVEGEKDVETLRLHGLTATTNTGGAGKWGKLESALLAGAELVILPDNDQAGQDHAADVVRKVHGTARSVRIVDLPGLPSKGDVSDWLNAGHTVAELEQLVAAAAPATPPAPTAPAARPPAGGTLSERILDELGTLGYRFRLNQLDDSIEVNGERITKVHKAKIRTALRDKDVRPLEAVDDIILTEADRNAYHPIREYLESLQWDGQNHIGELCDCLQSSDPPIAYASGDSPLHAVYLYRWLLGTVAKVYEHAQNLMLVLAGPQNLGKSSLVRWLGSPLPQYRVEGPILVNNKDTDVRLITSWIWEVSELDATTRKADVAAIKDFITREWITVRVPWGEHDIRKPALASLVGTVNDGEGFLADPTGNRRFLVTTLTNIDWRYTQLDVNQVWAQAVAEYKRGVPWQLQANEASAQRIVNRGHEVGDPIEGWLEKYFHLDAVDDEGMTTADIIDHLRSQDVPINADRSWETRIGAVLRRRGIAKRQIAGDDGRRARRYFGIIPKV